MLFRSEGNLASGSVYGLGIPHLLFLSFLMMFAIARTHDPLGFLRLVGL